MRVESHVTRKLLEALVGRWHGSIAVPLAKIGLGIVIPGLIVAVAVACMLRRHAYIIDRTGHLADVTGLPAIAVAIAYAAVGLFIYVHVCWEEHTQLAGIRDFARQILLGVIGVSLATTLALALI